MLIVICGPTATGKSELALELGSRLSSVIMSADSRQVYRELDVGTAKPSKIYRQLVPHYLIDICTPTDTLTLAQYQAQAQSLIASFASPCLLVGGTGLYIKAIVRGLKIPPVSPQPKLRRDLASLSQPLLYSFLCQVDSRAAQKIHPNDSVRTIRALEVFYVTGIPLSQQQGENPPSYPLLQIGLDCDNLVDRIKTRTEKMIGEGLVEEVATLGNKYGWDLPLLDTLGYREMKQYLAGEVSLRDAKDLIVLHTRQFAKRQRTWFRAYQEIEWFDGDSAALLDLVWRRVEMFRAEAQRRKGGRKI
ncbi:MAG: tRNA (adenosine(37)-N6)-dimethylallyltransferase MiaA [Prochloron sp. SP5CPC1]|nr:tRNA (adenosine(37)-N6)-dimethylallyltransferase MiaA [Candidatus Paraprochloron terpiosi SP5CPC1]